MSLIDAYKSSKIIESIENYSLADRLEPDKKSGKKIYAPYFYEDRQFWQGLFQEGATPFEFRSGFYGFTLSDWVARIPGYYWTNSAAKMREIQPDEIALQSKDWIELKPSGKSKKVLGGIGTLLFPPDAQGRRLMTLSAGCNASCFAGNSHFSHSFFSRNPLIIF